MLQRTVSSLHEGILFQFLEVKRILRVMEEGFSKFGDFGSFAELRSAFLGYREGFEGILQANAILKSLQFESMAIRHCQIAEAQRRTFDWIFSPHRLPQTDPRSKIDLASWLQNGDGIYWRTGKPGNLLVTYSWKADCLTFF